MATSSAPQQASLPTDAQLAARAQAGDRDAFTSLIERYQHTVVGLAYAHSCSFDESEEVAQEAFVRAWLRLKELREPERFRSWLFAITRSMVLRSRRDRSTQMRGEPTPMLDRAQVPSNDPSPLECAMRREEEAVLRQGLRRIPEVYRAALVLFYREERSLDKVAAALEISENTAKQRLHRGRRMLREEMGLLVESMLGRTRAGASFVAAVSLAISAAAAGRVEAGQVVRVSTTRATRAYVMAVMVPLAAWLLLHQTRPLNQRATIIEPRVSLASLLGSSALPPQLTVSRSSLPAEESRRRSASAPPQREIFRYDFEDGVLAPEWGDGMVLPSPPGNGSHFCLASTLETAAASASARAGLNLPGFVYSRGLVVEFDYWLGARGDAPRLQWLNPDKHLWYYTDLHEAVRGSWAHAVVRLADLLPRRSTLASWTPEGTPLLPADDGDRLSGIALSQTEAWSDVFYLDNVTFLEYQPGETPRTSWRAARPAGEESR